MQTPQIRTKFTVKLQIRNLSLSPCSYILDAEPTFMRAQNAQFIWAYIYIHIYTHKIHTLYIARSYTLLFIAAYSAML